MTEPNCRPRPTTYAKHPPQVWEAIRADYLAGKSVAWCAERHGVGYAIIDWRCRKHGWRAERQAIQREEGRVAREKSRQIDDAPREAATATAQTPEEAARAAFAQSAQALAEGRPGEAQVWAKLARSMSGMRLPGGDGGGGDDARTAADDDDDDPHDTAQYSRFRPGVPTAWDKLTQIAEKRLDMLFHDFWTGGRWDNRWDKPSYCIDQHGCIRRTWEMPDSWFEGFADDAERRAWTNATLPVSEIPPPPLGWILNVWMPFWNANHPDDPCTEVEATMIHQLYTRDPRLEWGYVDPQVQVARAKWEEEQREKGLPLPVIKAPWTDNDERRRKAREEAEAATLAQERATRDA